MNGLREILASEEPKVKFDATSVPSKKYLDLLLKAKHDENNAIQYGIDLAKEAPKEDLDVISEITTDENEHDSLYTQLIRKYAPYFEKQKAIKEASGQEEFLEKIAKRLSENKKQSIRRKYILAGSGIGALTGAAINAAPFSPGYIHGMKKSKEWADKESDLYHAGQKAIQDFRKNPTPENAIKLRQIAADYKFADASRVLTNYKISDTVTNAARFLPVSMPTGTLAGAIAGRALADKKIRKIEKRAESMMSTLLEEKLAALSDYEDMKEEYAKQRKVSGHGYLKGFLLGQAANLGGQAIGAGIGQAIKNPKVGAGIGSLAGLAGAGLLRGHNAAKRNQFIADKINKKIDNSDMSEDEKEQARDNLSRRIKQSEAVNTVSTLGAGLLGQAIGKRKNK